MLSKVLQNRWCWLFCAAPPGPAAMPKPMSAAMHALSVQAVQQPKGPIGVCVQFGLVFHAECMCSMLGSMQHMQQQALESSNSKGCENVAV